MDFKKLECFIALYEEKNFSRAADNMFMAQSSFSSQIKALEEELGVVLVNRDNKRDVHFTKEGSSFYEYAVATLNGYKNIRNQLRNSSSNSIKNIGLFYSSRLDNWTRKISHHNEKEPSNSFGILFSYGREKIEQLIHGDVFISLSYHNPELDKLGFQFRHCYYDYEAIGIPYSHPLAEKENFSIEDLKNTTIQVITPERTKIDQNAIHVMINKYGISPNNFHYQNRIGDLHFSIKTSNSVILMPADLMPDNCKIVPLKSDPYFKLEYGWYFKELTDNVQWVLDNL